MPQKRTWAQTFGKAARDAYRIGEMYRRYGPKRTVTRTRRRLPATPSKTAQKYIPGHYAGKFKRPKRKVKKVEYPCIVRDQRSWSGSSADTVYVCHSTHPVRYVWRMISMAMLHKYYASKGTVIRNWNDICGFYTGVGLTLQDELELVAVYKADLGNGDPQFQRIFLNQRTVTTRTYLETADEMASQFIALTGTATPSFNLFELQWKSGWSDNAGVGRYAPAGAVVWDALEISICVEGYSKLSCQNRTQAGDGTSGTGSENTNNIFSNPLQGKHYFIKGQGAIIRDIGKVLTNTSDQFRVDPANGIKVLASNASTLSSFASDSLKQPPYGNYFRQCTKTAGVRLEPGAIKESVCFSKVTKSLNGWLHALFAAAQFGGANSITNVSTQNAYYGESRIFGLEKVADMGVQDVDIAGERHAVYKSKMFIKKRRFTIPTSDQLA